MTFDEAIKRYTSNAFYEKSDGNLQGYLEFNQLAEWLKELKELKNKTKWIPVSERLPEENGEYLITWTTSQSKRRLIGFAEYELTGEYDYENNRFKGEWLLEDYVKNYPEVKVTAWCELPEPYKAERSDAE